MNGLCNTGHRMGSAKFSLSRDCVKQEATQEATVVKADETAATASSGRSASKGWSRRFLSIEDNRSCSSGRPGSVLQPKARLVALTLFSLLMLAGTGCVQQSSSDQHERPFEGLALRVSVPSGLGLAQRWRLLLHEWSEQTGADVEISEVAIKAGEQPSAEVLEQLKQSNLIFLPLADMATYAEAGLVAPFPQSALTPAVLDWNDVFRGLRVAVGSLEAKAAVLPISCPTLVLYYRADLLEKAVGRPPQTWEEYRRLVQNLQDWAPGHVAMEPWHPKFRATWFLARAAAYAQHPANYSQYFDIFTGEPLIDRPAFVRALKESLELLQFLPSEVLQSAPADCRRAILSGRAALAVAFEPASDGTPLAFTPYEATDKSAPSTTEGSTSDLTDTAQTTRDPSGKAPVHTGTSGRPKDARIGFCRLPGSKLVYNNSIDRWQSPPERKQNDVALVGFAGLCAVVPPAEETVRNAACHLLARLALERLTEAFPPAARTLCRESQIGQAAGWLGPELTADERERFIQCVGNTFRTIPTVAELPVVGAARFRKALSEGLGEALSGKKTAEQALKEVAEQWKTIAQQIGVAKVRDSYRRALGLPPRGDR